MIEKETAVSFKAAGWCTLMPDRPAAENLTRETLIIRLNGVEETKLMIYSKHHRRVTLFEVTGNQRTHVIDVDAHFLEFGADAIAIG